MKKKTNEEPLMLSSWESIIYKIMEMFFTPVGLAMFLGGFWSAIVYFVAKIL